MFLVLGEYLPDQHAFRNPLIRVICYSSAVSGGDEHLLLPWNAGFKVFGEFVRVLCWTT